MKAGVAGLAAFGPGLQLFGANASAAAKLVVQYDWLMSNGQIGDVAAVANGYFK
ncbi:MAG: nitrate ABC transporter substrate-binding protein, partial [Mesorhizobium sp.]